MDYSSLIFVESEKSDDDQSSSVVKPSSNKRRINPNVQTTFTGRKLKERKLDNAESSDSDSKLEAVSVNYKSKREQLSGPSDQGATATLVTIYLRSQCSWTVVSNVILGNWNWTWPGCSSNFWKESTNQRWIGG